MLTGFIFLIAVIGMIIEMIVRITTSNVVNAVIAGLKRTNVISFSPGTTITFGIVFFYIEFENPVAK